MNRTLEYLITSQSAGMTIEHFLKSQGFTRQSMILLKKIPESVLVDGKWEHLNYPLKENQRLKLVIIEMEISEKIPPIQLPFPVVFEDEDIVVVNKPANMPIHPSMNNYENTLGNAAAYYYKDSGENFVFRCINRLDRDTSGLTMIAKHQVAAGILYEQMARREIHRDYVAIVEGDDIEDEGCVDLPIGRLPGSTIERCIDLENGERAVTHYKVIGRRDGLAMLELWLETGRTHQIRVHMTHIGHPLPGDWLYNPGSEDKFGEFAKRQMLHSRRLRFTHPITKEEMMLEADLPEDMLSLWGLNLSL